MTKEHTFIRSNVVALAGVPNDVLTFWLRSGVLRPTQGQERAKMRLRFSRDQVRIAAVLNQARNIGLNIEALRALADTLHECERWIAEFGMTADDVDAVWDELQQRSRTPEMEEELVAYLKRANDFETIERHRINAEHALANPPPERILVAVDSLEARSPAIRGIVLGLMVDEGLLALFKDDAGDWIVKQVPNIEMGLPSSFCVLFDLSKVFAEIDWARA